MSKTEQAVAKAVQTLACIWVVGLMAGTIVLFAFFRNNSVERLVVRGLAILQLGCFQRGLGGGTVELTLPQHCAGMRLCMV